MTDWIRQFSVPDRPADDAVLETVVTAQGQAVGSLLLNKYAIRIAESTTGLVDFIRAWIDRPSGRQTAWDLSFGRAHLALKEGKLDPVEAAVRVGLRIANCGQSGAWKASISPMCVQLDDRFAEEVTSVEVISEHGGACGIWLRLASGHDLIWRRDRFGEPWSGDGGRLESVGVNRPIYLLPQNALPAENHGGEIFKECQPVSEITADIVQSFQDGFNVLARNAPQYIPWVERVLNGIVVASRQAEYRLVSGSWEDVPSFMHISSPHSGIDIAEILVHECAHQYFYMLQRVGHLDDSRDKQLYWSPPIRKNRPISRILMAYHALANVQLLYRAVLEDEKNDRVDIEYVRINEPDLQSALRALDEPLRGNPALTPLGRGLYEPLAEHLSAIAGGSLATVSARGM
jgi:hypothetical protein